MFMEPLLSFQHALGNGRKAGDISAKWRYADLTSHLGMQDAHHLFLNTGISKEIRNTRIAGYLGNRDELAKKARGPSRFREPFFYYFLR